MGVGECGFFGGGLRRLEVGFVCLAKGPGIGVFLCFW